MKETAYLLQVVLIVGWWVGLITSDSFFKAFQYDQIPPMAFWSFALPDLILLAGLSVVRVYWQRQAIEFILFGAFGYATLYCVHATMLTGSGVLPTSAMLIGWIYNGFLCFSPWLFRRAAQGQRLFHGLKTLIQIVCIWGLTLAVFPIAILEAFDSLAWPDVSLWTTFSGLLFTGMSGIGLSSAYVMVRDGDGTPLPLDQTNRLVTAGPYRFVRNPMALAGIGQGLAIALAFRSLPLLVYSLLGATVWQWVIRPVEERDLIARFGLPYQRYRERVSCWVPRWSQFRVAQPSSSDGFAS